MATKLVEMMKTNVGFLSSMLTVVASVAAGFIFLDDRYAHAADYVQQQNAQTRSIQQFRTETALQLEQLQLNSLDDKIFYLEQKVDKTPADVAQLNRFERQRQDIAERIRVLRSNPPQ